MPTTLTNGIQLPDKGSVDWYSSMESNYNLIDTHLGDTDVHVTAEDKANWDSKQGSLSQAQLDAIAQVDINTNDIATLQSDKADASHTHSSSDITDIDDYATKDYVDNSISDLVDNAPDALNTLNELSAALNDDSNFASTVTTALATKVNSADLATVATTGDYDDLSNKPSIPTNTSDLTNDSGFITSSDVPTSTSDLINDSNFVDTSNSAVSSGITSTKVTDYDTHIADTDIHVTTTDKNRWNNQTYVFRYSSTALTASSTNSNTLLDNTDNLKVGDKVIDSSGVLFSITAIDTANSTFTIGTALIDLAQDSDVVHKSGNETISGDKNFQGLLTTIPNASLWPTVLNTTDDVTYLGRSVIHIEYKASGQLTDLSSGAWGVAEMGAGCFFFRINNGMDIRYKNLSTGNVNRIPVVSGANRQLNNVTPETDNTYSLGESTKRWSTINGLEPSSLSLPSGNSTEQIDISSYFTNTGSGEENSYTASVNGWIYLRLGSISGCQATVYDANNNRMWGQSVSGSVEQLTIPILKGQTLTTQWATTSSVTVANAYFIPCKGNV